MDMANFDRAEMAENLERATGFLKSLSNANRLMILCHLVEGEVTVSELENSLDLRQPALSQNLARLREDGLVKTRRQGRNIYYSFASREAQEILSKMYELFCTQAPKKKRSPKKQAAPAGD